MSGAVTYDGVKTATGGTIFKDMVFWVAQRVPIRNDIVNHIKNNGGKVVPLEKDAHILIADHARKDAHPDSYSWKYITDSVEHGCAQLTDRYRIFGHPETGRDRVGASAPVKKTRTPFSAADDAALANWVLAHTRGRTGNSIYQEFAETHSWHTWQSWRNRFMKSLANLPIANLERLAMSAADLAVQTAKSSTQSISNQGSPEQKEERTIKAAVISKKFPSKAIALTPERAGRASASTSPDASNAQVVTRSMMRNEQQSDKAQGSPTRSEEGEGDHQDATRDNFYIDLLAFAEETEAAIDPDPCIDGKLVDLFDLSQAVAMQKVPPEEVDWMTVAEDLDFNWVENEVILTELQRCYKDNLADFFEAMSSFIPKSDGNFYDEERFVPEATESDLRSSPPRQRNSRKRSMDDDSLSRVGNSSKNRRLSRNTEIPSTPEDKIGVLPTQSPSVLQANQKRRAHSSSTEKSTALESPRETDDEEMYDEDQADAGKPDRQAQLHTQQSAFDATPSQQLHSEALDTSPTTINLRNDRGSSGKQQAENSEPAKETNVSPPKRKTTGRASKRSLPVSFDPVPGRFSRQQAEERARRPSAPIRVDLDEEGKSQDIRDCAEYYESLGYSRSIVIESLMRTTMTPGWPTSLLLEMLSNKEGVPSNYEGIWTDRDDKSLRYADAIEARKFSASTRELNKAKKELDRIVHKHTPEAVDLRRRFLQAQARMSQQ
ncbi:hypothetical protein ED733_000737 [Metarhizium rileyi]|uniref:DNA-binding protein RAP1 n=1 Tax=Metarhizium rileyi (strain RCEF 4871) TaxID=1649241 RepID=A0A5C6G662_METRR|nr:hypothetical protein ED733_000737 [Metarhizium rileyi]